MAERQEHKWNNMSLKSLEAELRRLPEVKPPEKLKMKLLSAIPNQRQKVSTGHHGWYVGARDVAATAAAVIFIFASMFLVNYGLPNPPQTLLTELNDTSLWRTAWEQDSLLYDQNCPLIKDNNCTGYDELQ